MTSLAPSASPWLANGEEVLDTEMVHAVAPGADIVEVLVNATSLDNAASAVAASVAALRLGVSLGSVISISAAGQTGGEHCDTHAEVAALHAALQVAAAHNVTVVAASGDIGAVGEPCDVVKGLTGGAFPPVKEVNLPASDPLVLAAGGTTLTASHKTGAYVSESAWGLPFGDPGSQFQASGGGLSRVFSRPSYQDGVPGIRQYRGVPDVAADASPHTGMALVMATGGDSYTVRNSGGTSAERADLGRARRPGRPVRRPSSRLRQRRHLPHRPQRLSTTRRSMTSPTGTTRLASPQDDQRLPSPRPAGTRSPAGGARTRTCSSRCSLATFTPTTPEAFEDLYATAWPRTGPT